MGLLITFTAFEAIARPYPFILLLLRHEIAFIQASNYAIHSPWKFVNYQCYSLLTLVIYSKHTKLTNININGLHRRASCTLQRKWYQENDTLITNSPGPKICKAYSLRRRSSPASNYSLAKGQEELTINTPSIHSPWYTRLLLSSCHVSISKADCEYYSCWLCRHKI
jgi:hypothetical protein